MVTAPISVGRPTGNQYFIRYYDAGYSETVTRNRLIWNFAGNASVDPNNPNASSIRPVHRHIDERCDSGFTKSIRDEKESRFEMARLGKNLFAATPSTITWAIPRNLLQPTTTIRTSQPRDRQRGYDNTTLPNWPAVKTLPERIERHGHCESINPR